jgi:hypothetical protein
MKRSQINIAGIVIISLLFSFVNNSLCTGQPKILLKGNQTGNDSDYRYPLTTAGPGKRYLVDQDNKPFFWSGDTGWSLIAQLNREDVDFYFANRHEKGFNVVLVSLIEHKFCNKAPANYYGELPFTTRTFTTPNEKYFEHADYVIRSAAARNIVLLLDALYLGYDCKDEGWCAEVKAASPDDLRSWGRYIGNRYKEFGNIVWLVGGDTDPGPVRDKILEMVKGIRETDTLHLITAHNQPESMAVSPWKGESWLSVNNVYSYDSVLYRQYRNAYELYPVIPYYEIESAYENEHNSTPQQLRSQAYRAVLSGAMGHVFGNCPVWHFGSWPSWCNLSDWKTELDNRGSEGMDHLQRLFRSRMWFTLIPDFDHTALISGFGTWGRKDYVTTAVTADRNTLIAYLPSPRKVIIDMRKMSGGSSDCWWFDPSSGRSEFIGSYKNSASQSFTPSTDGDIILVIDNAEMNLPAPGNGHYKLTITTKASRTTSRKERKP